MKIVRKYFQKEVHTEIILSYENIYLVLYNVGLLYLGRYESTFVSCYSRAKYILSYNIYFESTFVPSYESTKVRKYNVVLSYELRKYVVLSKVLSYFRK